MQHSLTNSLSKKWMTYTPAFVISFLAQACEFDSRDDNFHLVKPPPEEIRIGVDLAGVNPLDTIYAYNYTWFHYSLSSEGKEIVAQQFLLDGQEVNMNAEEGYAAIETTTPDNQVHDLTLIMAVRSGSGSLADYTGYENYFGEFHFKVKILDDEFEDMGLMTSPDENKHLKLRWRKPNGYGEISGYEIYSGQQLLATINDPNVTSWVDEDYAYGYKHYQVKTKVLNGWDVTISDATQASHTTMQESNFELERLSVDRLKLKWHNPNPYSCKYVLRYRYDQPPLFVEEGAAEAIVPVEGFPFPYRSLTLYILPSLAAFENYEGYSYVSTTYSDQRLNYGITLEPDVPNNRILTLNFDRLEAYGFPDITKLSTSGHALNLSTGSQLKVSNTGNIAISDGQGGIHVYQNSDMTAKLFSIEPQLSSSRFYFTNTGLILTHAGSGFRLYNVNTGNQVLSKEWEKDPDNPDDQGGYMTATISKDGKHIFVKRHQYGWSYTEWAELYRLNEDFSLSLLKTIADPTISAMTFHPANPGIAIIQHNNATFDIMEVNGQVLKTVQGTFLDIDPFTGNLLYHEPVSHDQLQVLDNAFNPLWAVKLQNMGYSTDYIRLYNNFLFYGGFYAEILRLARTN